MGEIREFLGDTSEIRLVDFLTQNMRFDYTLTELKNYTGLSKPTLLNAVRTLLRNKLIEETRTVGRAKFYALADNEITKALTAASLAHTTILSEEENKEGVSVDVALQSKERKEELYA